MKYFKLNLSGTQWVLSTFDSSKRQVTLYNDDLSMKGIGQY